MSAPDREHHRVSDESDRATLIEMEALSDSLARTQRLVTQKQKPLADGTYAVTECEECSEEIGEERLKVAANNLVCWHCQTATEGRKKWFSK
jgi:RNA polymerase-binding transcription factor DksA